MRKSEEWFKNPIRFLAMTGYSIENFNKLLPYFKETHDEYLEKYKLNGKLRSGQRKYSLYANSPLPTHTERLCFILSYLKLNPLQEAHADLFSMQQQQCNELIHGLKVILDKTLSKINLMPAKTDKELQVKLENMQKKELLHDVTEREIPRPQDSELQKAHYSGKKKKHTIKNTIISDMNCFVFFVSVTVLATMHDKKMADTLYSIPAGFELWQDSGYQGYSPENVTIYQPTKKPKGKELTTQQKQENKTISQVRIRIEHTIGSIKRYRMVKDECRLRKNQFTHSVIHTCAALHNLRVKTKPFQYPDYQQVIKSI